MEATREAYGSPKGPNMRDLIFGADLPLTQVKFREVDEDADLPLTLVDPFPSSATLKIEPKTSARRRHRSEKPVNFREDADLPLTQVCLLYTSPSPRDKRQSRMPSSA